MIYCQKIVSGGFGDPYNHYAHSTAFFNGHLYVGTSRANLVFLKFGMANLEIPTWPVPTPFENYSAEFEERITPAEIWQVSPSNWDAKRVYQSPYHPHSVNTETPFRSNISYRTMCTFSRDGSDPILYVASTSRSRGDGPELLVTREGSTFTILPKLVVNGQPEQNTDVQFTSIRNLIQLDELLITCVTGGSRGNINTSLNSQIFATDSPESGLWHSINGTGFGSYPNCFTVFSLCVHQGSLYAGTAGLGGFDLYRGRRTDKFHFEWERIVEAGGGRGALNQGVASLCSFRDYLYIGTGIQNGGFDRRHNIGPAAFELLRLDGEHHLELLVGTQRDETIPLSGMGPGFDNPFNAYLWKLAVHEGWIYAGTMDWSLFSLFTDAEHRSHYFADQLSMIDIQDWLVNHGGADLWRSRDGQYWEPVTTNGFNNFYNFGIRTLVSGGNMLFAGTANPFSPDVWDPLSQNYKYNLRGGLEIFAISS